MSGSREPLAEEVLEARAGLKLPGLEFENRNSIRSVYDAYDFMWEFWIVNGMCERDPYGRWKPKADFLELVVPPGDHKPLVVVRYTYSPTSEETRLREKIRNEGSWGSQLITYEYQRHAVLIPPTRTGSFETFLKVDHRVVTGSTSGAFPEPDVYFRGESIGYSLDEDANRPQIQAALTAFVELVG